MSRDREVAVLDPCFVQAGEMRKFLEECCFVLFAGSALPPAWGQLDVLLVSEGALTLDSLC